MGQPKLSAKIASHGGTEYLNSLKPWSGDGDFSPENTKKTLRLLDNPQDSYPTIHIGGTNGKGSTSVFCASIIGASGLKVGLTISPHFISPTERIIVDGEPISEATLNELMQRIKALNIELTYHEALTVAAFLHFRDESVDYAVIEVGLGGRLDSTNVIKSPKAIAITSIGLDHEAVLGGSEEEIAKEKAGIVKEGVPVFLGDVKDSLVTIFGSNAIKVSSKDFSCFEVKLKGAYQGINMAVAEKLTTHLGFTSIKEGLENAFLPGRFERIGGRYILDSAHNPQAFHRLKDSLSACNYRPNVVIFGALKTKNYKELCKTLKTLTKKVYLVEPESEMAVPCKELEKELSGIEVKSYYKNYRESIEDGEGNVLICGSMYFLGIFREILGAGNKPLWKKIIKSIT